MLLTKDTDNKYIIKDKYGSKRRGFDIVRYLLTEMNVSIDFFSESEVRFTINTQQFKITNSINGIDINRLSLASNINDAENVLNEIYNKLEDIVKKYKSESVQVQEQNTNDNKQETISKDVKIGIKDIKDL